MHRIDTSELLNKLFAWKKQIHIKGTPLYMRIVGDDVIEQARQKALAESRKLRQLLKTEGSDEYYAYITEVEIFTDDELRDIIANMSSRQVIRDYINNTPKPQLPELPDNPTLEQQEEYEAAKQKRDDDYLEEVQRHAEEWQKQYAQALKKRTRADLESTWKKLRIDRLAEEKFSNIFQDYIVGASIYVDEELTQRLFPDVNKFKEVPSQVRDVLREEYDSLSVSIDDIKN